VAGKHDFLIRSLFASFVWYHRVKEDSAYKRFFGRGEIDDGSTK
jgi:hypothetical protein